MEGIDDTFQNVVMDTGAADGDSAEWEEIPVEDGAPVDETITYAIRDLLDSRYACYPSEALLLMSPSRYDYRKYKDTRTWQRRLKNLDEAWKPLIPLLAEDYMQWQCNGNSPSAELPPSEYDVEIDIVDLFSSERVAVIHRHPDQELARALVVHGYLGTTPVRPELAISLRTLEHFRLLRLFKPSFSVEAFTKLLCYNYVVSSSGALNPESRPDLACM